MTKTFATHVAALALLATLTGPVFAGTHGPHNGWITLDSFTAGGSQAGGSNDSGLGLGGSRVSAGGLGGSR